jgi:hypothetical protein
MSEGARDEKTARLRSLPCSSNGRLLVTPRWIAGDGQVPDGDHGG